MQLRWPFVVVSLLSLAACDRNPAGSGHPVPSTPAHATPQPAAQGASPTHEPAAPPADGEERGIAGGLSWRADEPLVYRRPSNPMRAAEYGVRDSADAELTVFHFPSGEGGGGDVQSNITRWVGQFTQPDGRPSAEVAQIAHREVNGMRVTTVDVTGTFAGRMGMGAGGAPRESWRMLGAIVEGPEGHVFFKLIGPEAGVGDAADAFEGLVASIHAG